MDFIVSKLSLLTHSPLFIALIVLIVAVLCRKIIWRLLKAINKKIERNLFIYALLVSTLSTVAIYYGIGHSSERWLYDIVRSVIAAMGMFVGKLDLSNISIKENEYYIALILVLYICSLLTTVKLLLKFVLFRFTSWVKVKFGRYSNHNRPINIFWGINEASYMLAKQIVTRNGGKVVFICTNDLRDFDSQKSIGTGRILDLMSLQRKDIEKLEDIGALVANCHIDLTQIEINSLCEDADIFKMLELEDIAVLIENSSQARIFFLSESEEKNILQAINIMNDRSILAAADKAHIYIHARRSSKNEIYNQHSLYSASKIKVSVIDSSFLSIALLKRGAEYHPVNVVNIETSSATVDSPFNSMVIGFGETGIEAFKFMYEFGSFVTKEGTKTPFSTIAIDAKMDQIAGAVRTQMPDIKENELELFSATIDSEPFWDKISKNIGKLNYIFITINNDKKALSLAIDIYKYALRQIDGELKNFKIFVRAHSSDSARHMRDVVTKLTAATKEQTIIVFGSAEDIYTYDIIIDDSITKEAMLYHYAYSLACQRKSIVLDQALAEQQWNSDFGAQTAVLSYEQICNIAFKVEQNISNSLHIATKMALLGIDSLKSIEAYSAAIENRGESKIYDKQGSSEALRLLNVSKCEHERWNSATRLMGFVNGAEKVFIKHTHPSLCPWDKIEKESTQAYDCIVVEVSMEIFKTNIQKSKI